MATTSKDKAIANYKTAKARGENWKADVINWKNHLENNYSYYIEDIKK